MKRIAGLVMIAVMALLPNAPTMAQEGQPPNRTHVVLPGESWAALAAGYGVSAEELQTATGHPNRQRQPPIGVVIQIPGSGEQVLGTFLRPFAGGVTAIAAEHYRSPWYIAIRNGLSSPYRPLLYTPLFIPGGSKTAVELPAGFGRLELSQLVGKPGEPLALRAQLAAPAQVQVAFDDRPVSIFIERSNLVGLMATGAFFGAGEPELTIQTEGSPLWSQPWLFQEGSWTFQDITLTGQAAAIDQQSIAEERARLFEIWSLATPQPVWDSAFQLPITDFLEYSSEYGARRSYNGGPYSSYHEGVDFSAYGGTAVFAPADANVVLAEQLYVRGGAVILDHGLGIYTGYYHLSDIGVSAGQRVVKGERLGGVGTTGLSTGNHLHWDMLVDGTWVDATAWLEADLGCWILEGFGRSCP